MQMDEFSMNTTQPSSFGLKHHNGQWPMMMQEQFQTVMVTRNLSTRGVNVCKHTQTIVISL